ncbi:MAG: hypothetical protein SPG64_05415 [Candidatus Enteromonas sp.]|nr:hypothetical protein [Candidatus Enteromonas sp.]
MKKKRFSALVGLSALMMGLSSCSIVKMYEKDITYRVFDDDTLLAEGVINIFNNALLPSPEDRSNEERFYRFCVGEEVYSSETPEEKLYPAAGLLRYNDVAKYAVNNVLTVRAVFLDLEDIPKPWLVIGWYDKTSTSKVSQESIDRWTPDLMEFLANNETLSPTEEELADVAIRPYGHNGNVADMGNEINKDGTVDVMIGVGGNINTTAGVEIKEKYQIVLEDGTTWRYIARLTDRPQASAVYEWLKTPDGYGALVG